MDYKIIHNRAMCKLCGDVIESKSVHDFVQCKCGEILIDGGHEYFHRGANNLDNIIDMSLSSVDGMLPPPTDHDLEIIKEVRKEFVGDSDHEHDDRIL